MKPLYEVLSVFALVMLAIWGGEITFLPVWPLALPAVFLLLNYWRNNPDRLKNLWKPDGETGQYILLIFVSLVFWRSITLTGELNNPKILSQPDLLKNFSFSLFCYLPNALWQQILVNGYFLPRLEEGFQIEWKAILALGLLFGLVHIPNPVLVPVTMVGGMLSAYFFKRTRNIYVLIIAHSVLAVSVLYFLPETWHHHLMIGPGYFRNWVP